MATWPGKDPSMSIEGDQFIYSVSSHPPCGKTSIKCTAKGDRHLSSRIIKEANNQLKKNMTRHMKTCKICSAS